MNFVKNWRLRTKTIVPALVIMVLVSVVLGVWVNSQQKQQAAEQARQSAKAISEQIKADRAVYTERVVQKMKKDGIEFKANDMKRMGEHGAIPLPASFVHLTSAEVNKRGFHTADLLSLWNINPDKKPRNKFEENALELLARDPSKEDQTWEVRGSGANAQFVAVYADIASAQACVDCHNQTVESKKRDFRLNDVMGGLVISVPLKEAYERADKAATILTASLLGGFAIILFVISYVQWAFISKPLLKLEKAADKISMGDMDQPIIPDSTDEVGSLSGAFERMRVSLAQAMKALDRDD